ncbi:MAG: hypothetical protein HGJ97_13850 [Desulfosporosinus sp.]|nr:hypothetical protein [Desulfosporosinus sp.]
MTEEVVLCKKVYKLLLLFCLLNAKFITTMQAISHGAVEGNPLAYYFVNNNALQYFKLVGVAFLCVYLVRAAKRDLKSQLRVIRVLWWANVAYSLIVVYNTVVYFVQKYQFVQLVNGPPIPG